VTSLRLSTIPVWEHAPERATEAPAPDAVHLMQQLVLLLESSSQGTRDTEKDSEEVLLQLSAGEHLYVLSRCCQPHAAETRTEAHDRDVHGWEAELSPREYEIARLVAQGLPNKTIAAVLEISYWTVSTHLRRMFAKLNARSRAELVARVFGSNGDRVT
jgi:DNA-binding CsgD family transcriptional regulator